MFLPDVKSIWGREYGSQHVRIFHDIYVDYIRDQRKRTYRIITLPHMLANVIGDLVSGTWSWRVTDQCLSDGGREEGEEEGRKEVGNYALVSRLGNGLAGNS